MPVHLVTQSGILRDSLVAQTEKSLLAVQETQETWIRSLGCEDPLQEEIETQCNILAWDFPWPEEPGGLQSMGL